MKPEVRIELTDKEKILVQAQQEADAIKQDKLLEYKNFLEKERENFEKLKKETVERLNRDLAQFGFQEDAGEKLVERRWCELGLSIAALSLNSPVCLEFI